MSPSALYFDILYKVKDELLYNIKYRFNKVTNVGAGIRINLI
jgi:hypothetical protein